MSNVKKVILRKNEEGNIYKLHPETDAEQVLAGGETLGTVLNELKDKVIAGMHTANVVVPSKTPKNVTIQLEQALEDTNYIVLAQARGTGDYQEWICATAAYLLNANSIIVTLLNHGSGATTGDIIVDYALLKV